MGKCMDIQVNKLMATGNLEIEELTELLKFRNPETTEYLKEKAKGIYQKVRGNKIQLWGRIPISSYCKYDCKICGLQRDNQFAKRFRMDPELVLQCCSDFAAKGVKTFLLESGDDVYFSEKRVEELLLAIRQTVKGCRIILSLGEKPESAYRAWHRAGAIGYILRHGSANEQHFRRIYPQHMSQLLRKQCLWNLKKEGYHVGTGFLIGIPFQNIANVVEDIFFMRSFGTGIVDMGAFVPAARTPYERERSGNGDMAIYIMSILRLMLPNSYIPANPTLDCVMRDGRLAALSGGADAVIVDLEQPVLMESYEVYGRKNGRLPLPLDRVEAFREQIEGLGYQVE